MSSRLVIVRQLFGSYSAQLISSVSGLLFGILIARALAPEGRGVVATAMSIYAISILLSNLGISNALVNRLNSRSRFSSRDYFGALVALYPFLFTLACLLTVIMAALLMDGQSNRRVFWLLLFPPVVVGSIFCRSVLRARMKINRINMVTIAASLTRLGLILWGWNTRTITIDFVILAELIYQFVTLLGLLIFTIPHLKKWPRFQDSRAAIRSLLSFGLYFQLYSVLFNLGPRVSVPLLSYFSGDGSAGIYVVAARLGELLGLFAQQILFVMTPYFTLEKTSDDSQEKSIRVARLALLVLYPASFMLFVLSDWLVTFLYGDAYAQSGGPLMWIVVATFLGTIYQLISIGSAAKGRFYWANTSVGVGLVLNIGVLILLAPEYGATGAAVAFAIGNLICLAIYLGYLWRELSVSPFDVLIPRQEDINLLFKLLSGFMRRRQ